MGIKVTISVGISDRNRYGILGKFTITFVLSSDGQGLEMIFILNVHIFWGLELRENSLEPIQRRHQLHQSHDAHFSHGGLEDQ